MATRFIVKFGTDMCTSFNLIHLAPTFFGKDVFIVRKGFLVEAVPIMLTGTGGPGAPHHFEFQRREALGFLDSFG